MQVQVRKLDGCLLSFEVAVSDTVHSLKLKIEERHGVPLDQQRLVFAGIEIIDDHLLSAYNITSESVIHLVTTAPSRQQLTIELLNRKEISVEVDVSEKVSTLKQHIQEASGIGVPLSDTDIVYHDMVLADEKTVASYEISSKASLSVRPRNATCVTLVSPDNQQFQAYITEADSVDTIQRWIMSQFLTRYGLIPCFETISITHNGMVLDGSLSVHECQLVQGSQIHLYSNSSLDISIIFRKGDSISVHLCLSDTVEGLCAAIQREKGFPVSLDLLNFVYDGRVLESGHSLAFYGIHDGAEVQLVRRPPLQLSISTPDGNHFDVKIKPSATVMDLMSVVEDKLFDSDFPVSKSSILLEYNDIPLVSEQTLLSYGLHDGCMIQMRFAVSLVLVNTEGHRFNVKVDPHATIYNIKQTFSRDTSVCSPDHMVLCDSNDKQLSNSASLDESQLRNGAVLPFMVRSSVEVNLFDGSKLEVNVGTAESVDAIKEKLQTLTGIVKQHQVLLLGDEEMAGAVTLDQCEQFPDVIKLNTKFTLRVMKTDGSIVSLAETKASDTVQHVKCRLYPACLEAGFDTLLYDRVRMDNYRAKLHEYGITQDATVRLLKSIRLTVHRYDSLNLKILFDNVKVTSTIEDILQLCQGRPSLQSTVVPLKNISLTGSQYLDHSKMLLDYAVFSDRVVIAHS